MDINLKRIYEKFLNLKEGGSKKVEHPKLKCKARKSKCSNCGYKFRKGDSENCPQCGEKRKTCDRWAMNGKEVCHIHGGHAGRKMTKGVFVTAKSFTKTEMEIIKQNMEKKVREHEFVYQVATAAFKKIMDNTLENEPEHILEAAAIYFSKISKYIQDIDAQEASMVHIHTFDEIDKKKLEEKIKNISNRVLQNALLIIVSILKKEINDMSLYNKIYSQIPEAYRMLIEFGKNMISEKNDG